MTANEHLGTSEDAVAKAKEDIEDLKSQIRNLLKTMQAAENIETAPILHLCEPDRKLDDGKERSFATMDWSDNMSMKRHQRKGKVFPTDQTSKNMLTSSSKVVRDFTPAGTGNNTLNCLNEIELSTKDTTAKYLPMEDSVYFVPVLDRCILGFTLLNVTQKQLSKPMITVSLESSHNLSFFYDVQIVPKNVSAEQVGNLNETRVPVYDVMSNDSVADSVYPGGQIFVSVNFGYPAYLNLNQLKFSLLICASLDGNHLWAKQVQVTSKAFDAANIEYVFKRHRVSLLAALGAYRHLFEVERLLSYDEKSPQRSLERFLGGLGFTEVASLRTGFDTTTNVYTSNQPSILWGSCFQIEKCSRKSTSARCAITTRTADQLQVIHLQFKNWLVKERRSDHGLGMTGLKVLDSNPINKNQSILQTLEEEIQFILKFQQIKAAHREESRRVKQLHKDDGSDKLYSRWLQDYCTCVESTDFSLVKYME